LIDVQDYDLSACGGTHVERTGAIGMIAIGGWEKFKGGSRVEFLCGGRALQRFRVWRGALSAVQKHLSVPPIDMAASIERMQEDAKTAQRTVRGFTPSSKGPPARPGGAPSTSGGESGRRLLGSLPAILTEGSRGWCAPAVAAGMAHTIEFPARSIIWPSHLAICSGGRS